MNIMLTTYEDAIEWLYNLQWFGIKLGLEKIKCLLGLLRNPQNDYKFIHVGGTNGKGSVCTMVGSILQEAGYKTGVNTSPHLIEFTERITVNGEQISREDVTRLIAMIKPMVEQIVQETELEHPTYFEVVTAIALKYFAEQNVEFVVLEVGLGGTYDATNIVMPLVSVITPVSLDHTDMLGTTLTSVAENKAGIIKQNGILVTDNDNEEVMKVIESTCQAKSCRLFKVGNDVNFEIVRSDLNGSVFNINGLHDTYGNMIIPIIGDYQVANAATAVAAVELLREHNITIAVDAVRDGLANIKWPGRLEILQISPYVVVDCAHNPSAARALKANLKKFEFERLILIIGMCEEKDIKGYFDELVPEADEVIVTRAQIHRAAEPATICSDVEKLKNDVIIQPTVQASIDYAMNKLVTKKDLICITGSIFIVAEARELMLNKDFDSEKLSKFRISY